MDEREPMLKETRLDYGTVIPFSLAADMQHSGAPSWSRA